MRTNDNQFFIFKIILFMLKIVFIQFFIVVATIAGFAAPVQSIENNLFRISIPVDFNKSPRFFVLHKAGNITRTIIPKLHIAYAKENPNLVASSADGHGGVIGWKNATGKIENNIYTLGGADVVASNVVLKSNQLVFTFQPGELGEATLVVALPLGNTSPSFVMGIQAAKEGWFSLGFTGLTAMAPQKLDFLYQPLTWSWKRFPSETCITEEAYATTAATFINTDGYTEGVAAAPEMIPYRYAHSLQWNNAGNKDDKFWDIFSADESIGKSLFGFSVRNDIGLAQPTVFAPLLGGDKSYLQAKQHYQFTCKYLLVPGSWTSGTEFLLQNIFHYKNERQNAMVSLNQTFDNMLNYAMNDLYSGWVADLKGSDYRFDAPNTVKNVSALHALGLAMVTGNETIYKLRALPMIAYVMSREKFLFSIEDKPHQTQSPSHLLKGPCVDIGELSGLAQMTEGKTPAFKAELNRLFGKSRMLNMNTETGGGSWQDYLARYQISQDKDDLAKAKEGAAEYLKQVYDHYSQTFHDAPGLKDKGAFFTTDFGYRIYDLFQLFEQTGIQRYLDAAVVGAKQLLLWNRSNPVVPDSIITVNRGGEVAGIFPGRRTSNLEGSGFTAMEVTSRLPEQKVPAWQTSLNGLVPEGAGTYTFGPVMLAEHAPWLLRLAKLSGDKILKDAAYNAVIGRYANFPGYYFTSLETNVYQQENYPMKPYFDVKYNAIFYNHIWPHLAMLMDFLVSDFYLRTAGKIDFPSVYAPGYAFLTSKVYGHKKGVFLGNKDVRLWMPSGAIQSSTVALNHLFGTSEKDLLLALANTSPKAVQETIRLNPSVIPWHTGQAYRVNVYHSNGKQTAAIFKEGMLQVNVPANGWVAYKIEGLKTQVPLFEKMEEGFVKQLPANRFHKDSADAAIRGTTTSMIIQTFPHFADFYLYSDRTEKDWQSAALHYKIGNEEWKIMEDRRYPFEFDVHLKNPSETIQYKLIAQNVKGEYIETSIKSFND